MTAELPVVELIPVAVRSVPNYDVREINALDAGVVADTRRQIGARQ